MNGIWEIKGDRLNRALYAIISYSRRMIYIGISYNIEKRYQDGHSKKPASNVRELIAGEHKLIHITDYIYFLAASKLEGMFADHFRELGWTVVNKMKPGNLGGSNRKWTKDTIREEAKKFKTKADFWRDSCSAYGAALHYGIIDELFYSGTYGETRWTKENIIKEAAPFIKKSEFERHNSSAYQAACRMNLIDEIFYTGNYNIWTIETVTEVAKQYKTKKEFQTNNSGAYNEARKYGILDDLFYVGTKSKYSKEMLLEMIEDCSGPFQLKRKNGSAYQYALKNGLLDELFPNRRKFTKK